VNDSAEFPNGVGPLRGVVRAKGLFPLDSPIGSVVIALTVHSTRQLGEIRKVHESSVAQGGLPARVAGEFRNERAPLAACARGSGGVFGPQAGPWRSLS
jgi:hypothetical protein